jgi:hypothetical protein
MSASAAFFVSAVVAFSGAGSSMSDAPMRKVMTLRKADET